MLHWNGNGDIPEELRELPAGTYVVEAVDQAPSLTADEERGIAQALASLRAGKGRLQTKFVPGERQAEYGDRQGHPGGVTRVPRGHLRR